MRIQIFHNTLARRAPDGNVSLIELACRRVPGLRFELIEEAPEDECAYAAELLRDVDESIVVVPVHVPEGLGRILDWRRAVERSRPLSGLCAVCFVLARHPKLDPRHWLEPVWTDVLDDYAELALPSSFVVWGDEEQQVKMFRLVAAISGLAREIESLAELRRLDERVRELESQVAALGNRMGPQGRGPEGV